MKRKILIKTVTREEQFNREKPRFNAFVTGHGTFKNKKAYNRKWAVKDYVD